MTSPHQNKSSPFPLSFPVRERSPWTATPRGANMQMRSDHFAVFRIDQIRIFQRDHIRCHTAADRIYFVLHFQSQSFFKIPIITVSSAPTTVVSVAPKPLQFESATQSTSSCAQIIVLRPDADSSSPRSLPLLVPAFPRISIKRLGRRRFVFLCAFKPVLPLPASAPPALPFSADTPLRPHPLRLAPAASLRAAATRSPLHRPVASISSVVRFRITDAVLFGPRRSRRGRRVVVLIRVLFQIFRVHLEPPLLFALFAAATRRRRGEPAPASTALPARSLERVLVVILCGVLCDPMRGAVFLVLRVGQSHSFKAPAFTRSLQVSFLCSLRFHQRRSRYLFRQNLPSMPQRGHVFGQRRNGFAPIVIPRFMMDLAPIG